MGGKAPLRWGLVVFLLLWLILVGAGFGSAVQRHTPPAWLLALFPVFFVTLWCLACLSLGNLSGWNQLQDLYPDTGEPTQVRLGGQSLSMGGLLGMPVNFNGCVTIELCAGGIRFRLWRIFGLFQRPFLVPWRDIAVDEARVFLMRRARLRLARWDGAITLRPRTYARLVEQAPGGRLSPLAQG